MALDVATLSMRVDATGMVAGDQALDRIAVKAATAEGKVTKGELIRAALAERTGRLCANTKLAAVREVVE